MTQTTQPCSWASFYEADKDLTIVRTGIENNRNLLLSVFDSLNKLSDELSRLDYELKRKSMEKTSVFDSLNKLSNELSRLGL
jgi:hypothetical protein